MAKFRYKMVWVMVSAIAGAFADTATISRTPGIIPQRPRVPKDLYSPLPRRMTNFYSRYYERETGDPYRWLENVNSEDSQNFITQQNNLTNQFLSNCTFRNDIKASIEHLWKYPLRSCPAKYGNKYYFEMTEGLQDQSVIYVQDTPEMDHRVFLDPNNFPESYILSHKKFSEDGKILAYSMSSTGTVTHSVIQFLNAETGITNPNMLKGIKYSSIVWTKDNKGIFYITCPERGFMKNCTHCQRGQRLFYHLLDQQQIDDVLVAEFKDQPLWEIDAELTDDGKWLLIFVTENIRDKSVYMAKLNPERKIEGLLNLTKIIDKVRDTPTRLHLHAMFFEYIDTNVTTIVNKFDSSFEYVANDGPNAFFRTNRNSPYFALVRINLEDYAEDKWTYLLNGTFDKILHWVKAVNGDQLVACYMHHVNNILQLHSLKTGQLLRTFPLDNGTIAEFSGHRKYSEIFYKFTSYLTPGIIYTTDLAKSEDPKIHYEIRVPGFDPSAYEVKQEFYLTSDHITTVPIFIVSKKGAVRNRSMPALLYGNGGFGVSIQPHFSVTRLVFVEKFNGVFAVANIRGGGEYGEPWHDGGRSFNKQNSFDDFHYAAMYLVENGYTTASKLAIHGVGNGGLLVAVCINQKPELYGAAVAESGFMDMLRYHHFGNAYALTPEYGNWEISKHYYNLAKYSPLHNVKVPPSHVDFPATLLLTDDHDDCIVPMHTYKHIATLQFIHGIFGRGSPPLLARIEKDAGRGGGGSTDITINKYTDILTFIAHSLGLKFT